MGWFDDAVDAAVSAVGDEAESLVGGGSDFWDSAREMIESDDMASDLWDRAQDVVGDDIGDIADKASAMFGGGGIDFGEVGQRVVDEVAGGDGQTSGFGGFFSSDSAGGFADKLSGIIGFEPSEVQDLPLVGELDTSAITGLASSLPGLGGGLSSLDVGGVGIEQHITNLWGALDDSMTPTIGTVAGDAGDAPWFTDIAVAVDADDIAYLPDEIDSVPEGVQTDPLGTTVDPGADVEESVDGVDTETTAGIDAELQDDVEASPEDLLDQQYGEVGEEVLGPDSVADPAEADIDIGTDALPEPEPQPEIVEPEPDTGLDDVVEAADDMESSFDDIADDVFGEY